MYLVTQTGRAQKNYSSCPLILLANGPNLPALNTPIDHIFLDCYDQAIGQALGSLVLGTAKEKKLRKLIDDLSLWAYSLRWPHSEARRFELCEAIGTIQAYLYRLK